MRAQPRGVGTGHECVAVPLAGSSRRDRLALVASAPTDRSDEAVLIRRAAGLRRAAAVLGPARRSGGTPTAPAPHRS
ncbi:hypothetical protein ACFVXE_00355 [Streptomyces sp. NPDC058231]|uniref:hypothetical protein n=1 Tax=Streptomyces sp. NPDC058231 TaxID=3346392 RepID=UPI0036F12757